jgi:hypothetical protein
MNDPTCPTCSQSLRYVKDHEFEAAADGDRIVVTLASSIFDCPDPEHGPWRVFISGSIVPYRELPQKDEPHGA